MKYLLAFIITAALLHGVFPRAAATSCRQGIDSLVNSARSITAYPNPASVSVRVKSAKNLRELVIYALDGRQVRRVAAPGKDNLVPVSGLGQGPYMLRALFEDGTRTSKMIIKQ
ncbi:Por secretion system C-terminal sorting domain-containing protein [Chitinophaga eiseniae]|uniref:Por secretion system C-terminal sorting domain-containing protein n=1 Tax=Chitinophaga eiseniae TaxID=634771 RepID=A0A1T4L461_9BACT|nr:T9SS type A sorting domain-containing protein [Chitinophaga eiseniae]SJZ49494.1 Por secretion system C-terminal sorting domain-containing protein [Chitinophaga eiseniae]